jgi:hypothetical protein
MHFSYGVGMFAGSLEFGPPVDAVLSAIGGRRAAA